MVWCNGLLADAIKTSKQCNRILVFLFQDENIEDGGLDLLKYPAVNALLESETFVAVRVQTSTELFNQFAAIYHFVPVPCLFFMRHDGQPIDIIGSDVAKEDACKRIEQCLHHAQKSGTSDEIAGKCGESPKPGSKVAVSQALNDDKDSTRPTVSSKNSTEASSERGGKSNRSDEDLVISSSLAEVPDQAYDTSDNDQPLEKSASLTSKESSTAQKKSTSAHVQFRLPSGDTHIHSFSADSTVRDIFKYVDEYLVFPVSRWHLSLSYPRRELSLVEGAKTLAEIGLVPNGVVLIIPANGEISQPSFFNVAGNLIYSVLQMPISAVNSVCSYVYSFLFGNSDETDKPSTDTQEAGTSTQPAARFIIKQTVRRRTQAPTTSVKREGNVHRLTFRQDESEDENNTWNGNSTQQM